MRKIFLNDILKPISFADGFLLRAFVRCGIIVATLGSTAYHWGTFIAAEKLFLIRALNITFICQQLTAPITKLFVHSLISFQLISEQELRKCRSWAQINTLNYEVSNNIIVCVWVK